MKRILVALWVFCSVAVTGAEMRFSASGDSVWTVEAFQLSPRETQAYLISFVAPDRATRAWLETFGERTALDNSKLLDSDPTYYACLDVLYQLDGSGEREGVKLTEWSVYVQHRKSHRQVAVRTVLCDTTEAGRCSSFLPEPSWSGAATDSLWAAADSIYAEVGVPVREALVRKLAHADSLLVAPSYPSR